MDNQLFESEETRSRESVDEEVFEFEPASASTPYKRKRKASEHGSLDSSMGEEPFWLAHNSSIEQEEGTSKLGRRK